MGTIERRRKKLTGIWADHDPKSEVAHPWLERHAVIFSTVGSLVMALASVLFTALIGFSSCQQQGIADATMARLSENSNQLAEIANSISSQQTELMRTQNELVKAEHEPLLVFEDVESLDGETALYRFTSFGGNPISPSIAMHDTFTYYVYQRSSDEEPLSEENTIGRITLNVFGRYSEESQNVENTGALALSLKECAKPALEEYLNAFYREIRNDFAGEGYQIAYSRQQLVSYNYQPKTQGFSIYALMELGNGSLSLSNRISHFPDKEELTLSTMYIAHENEFEKSPEDLAEECLAQWS